MTDNKICSGTVPTILATSQSKLNPETYFIGAIQNANPQFFGATYLPIRLYANTPLRPSFYDEGCFSTQCDLQTMSVCTKFPNIQQTITPNWSASLDSLYTSRDTYGQSDQARAYSVMHSDLTGSKTVPMPGL